jgi:hypothetical protein
MLCYHLPQGDFRIDRNALDDGLLAAQSPIKTERRIARLMLVTSFDALVRYSPPHCGAVSATVVARQWVADKVCFCRRSFVKRVKIATADRYACCLFGDLLIPLCISSSSTAKCTAGVFVVAAGALHRYRGSAPQPVLRPPPQAAASTRAKQYLPRRDRTVQIEQTARTSVVSPRLGLESLGPFLRQVGRQSGEASRLSLIRVFIR